MSLSDMLELDLGEEDISGLELKKIDEKRLCKALAALRNDVA